MLGLVKGEEHLPIAEVGGKFILPSQLCAHDLGRRKPISKDLLLRRFVMRALQGREFPIFQACMDCNGQPIRRPDGEIETYPIPVREQLYHMVLEDEKGKEMLQAEREYLEDQIRDMGR